MMLTKNTPKKDDANMEFSKRLQRLAESKGVNQTTLVRMTGITTGAMSNYFSKGRVPKVEELSKIARALDTTMDELYKSEWEPPPSAEPHRISVARQPQAVRNDEDTELLRKIAGSLETISAVLTRGSTLVAHQGDGRKIF